MRARKLGSRVPQAVTGYSRSWRNQALRDLEQLRVAGLSIHTKDRFGLEAVAAARR